MRATLWLNMPSTATKPMLRPDLLNTRAMLLSLWDEGLTMREMAERLRITDAALMRMVDAVLLSDEEMESAD